RANRGRGGRPPAGPRGPATGRGPALGLAPAARGALVAVVRTGGRRAPRVRGCGPRRSVAGAGRVGPRGGGSRPSAARARGDHFVGERALTNLQCARGRAAPPSRCAHHGHVAADRSGWVPGYVPPGWIRRGVV